MERHQHQPELILQARQQQLMMMESEHSSVPNMSSQDQADTKVLTDLKTLSDQIDLCVEMLKEQNGKVDTSNDALLGVIGFLEACVPRMVELVVSRYNLICSSFAGIDFLYLI